MDGEYLYEKSKQFGPQMGDTRGVCVGGGGGGGKGGGGPTTGPGGIKT